MPTSADLRPAPAPLDRTAPPALLGRDTATAYRGLVADVAARLAERFAAVERPWTGAAPADLAPAVAAVDLDRPLESFEAAFEEVGGLYLDDAVWFHHPRYLAHLNCPVALPAVAAETVLAAVNTSVDTWDQSAGGTLIEQRLIEWTARRIGFGASADGVFTSGGTQSNLHALLLAREEAVEAVLLKHRVESGTPLRGVEVLPRLRFFASPHSHFSVVKAARLLGLGEEAVVTVPADDWFRMNPAALDAAIETCREQGDVPAAVVATAGTTDFGSVDPSGRSRRSPPRTGSGCTWTPRTGAASSSRWSTARSSTAPRTRTRSPWTTTSRSSSPSAPPRSSSRTGPRFATSRTTPTTSTPPRARCRTRWTRASRPRAASTR
nr:hypothetical protein GCM10025732_19950 [Glycomyces mayteni]